MDGRDAVGMDLGDDARGREGQGGTGKTEEQRGVREQY
jgi:hypothetical protein